MSRLEGTPLLDRAVETTTRRMVDKYSGKTIDQELLSKFSEELADRLSQLPQSALLDRTIDLQARLPAIINAITVSLTYESR